MDRAQRYKIDKMRNEQAVVKVPQRQVKPESDTKTTNPEAARRERDDRRPLHNIKLS